MSPGLPSGFFTTELPGSPLQIFLLFDINDSLFFVPCRKSALYVVKFISLIINILFYGFCVLRKLRSKAPKASAL